MIVRLLGEGRLLAAGSLVVCATSCCAAQPPPPPTGSQTETKPAPTASELSPQADPLGDRPAVATPAPFVPPTPTVYTASNGMKVWLLERHDLPLVSVTLAIPAGAASDPPGKGGLALQTAGMLDEGAGALGAIELAKAIDTLGASLSTSADADSSFAELTVLKRNFGKAFSIFADVVTKPRFDPTEWKRVHALWLNDLKERASDPDATARVVFRAALFGPGHAYGHPWDGTVPSAKNVTLEDARSFYAAAWRPDVAILVAVGDIKREDVDDAIGKTLKDWKAPKSSAPAPLVPPPPKGPWPRLVIVDRPDAPQSVIAAVRPGLAAADPDNAALWRDNTAIGGSFTSRLNQDLREEHGWSYGARSRIAVTRGTGQIVSYASVVTDHTGDALKAMLGDLEKFARDGLTDEEVDKTRSQARAELVSAYESVGRVSGRLAVDAALGLPPDFEATMAVKRDGATREDLNRLAAKYYDPKEAIVVVVGPKAKVLPQLAGLGLPPPEMRDADGNVTK